MAQPPELLPRQPSRMLCQRVPARPRIVGRVVCGVLAGGFAVSLGTSPVLAQPVPAGSGASSAGVTPSAPLPVGPTEEISIVAEQGSVKAVRAGAVVWEHVVVRVSKGSPEPQAIPAPVRLGDVVHYCAEGQFYRTRVADGVVIERTPLAGKCTALASDGYTVTCSGGAATQSWTRTFDLSSKRERTAYLMTTATLPMQLRKQSQWLVQKGVVSSTQSPEEALNILRRAEHAAVLEEAIAKLSELAKQDPTNPWYDVQRSLTLTALGRAEQAKQAARDALAHDPRYDLELVSTARWLDVVDQDLADQAFRRGMKHLIEHGYEPELASTVLGMVMTMGSAHDGKPASLEQERAKLERFGQRLADLSPNVEGATYFYAAMATDAEKRGDSARTTFWRSLEARAKPSAHFGGPLPPSMSNGGTWFHLVYSLLIGLALISVVKLLRTLPSKWPSGVSAVVRYNPIARWTPSESLGALLGLGALVMVARRVSLTIAVIGALASMPITLGSGNLSHPEVTAYLDAKMGSAPEAKLLRAIGAQQEGDLGAAKQLYETMPDVPEAVSNLGAIVAIEGDRTRAETLWKKALSLRPGLDAASYNLGQDGGPRGERMKRLGIARPMLALPTAEEWGHFWEARVRLSDARLLDSPLAFVPAVFDVSGALDGPSGVPVALYTVMSVALLARGALVTRRGANAASEPAPMKASWLGWGLGLLMPGSARHYGVFGPAVATLAVFAFFGNMMLSSTGGVAFNVLDSLAMPSWSSYFGVVQNQAVSTTNGLVIFCKSWWVIWALNALFVAAMQRFNPDPSGPSFSTKPSL
ncbi:MAG: hypothetical protein U0165_15280 [Polyangiaceae bacterium]